MIHAPTELRLDFDHVTKRYGDRTVVDHLTFEVRPGRVTGFLGPNGSGKSTTMKVLLDLASADHGSATIGGTRYRELPDPASTVGVMIEPNAFHPGRSGRHHLEIVARAAGQPIARVEDALRSVDLTDGPADRRVGTYSLGMKQRLSLAAALLGDPSVLVLDEPANGLDPQGIHDLRDLLRTRAERGHTVLVSSHLLTEMQHLADDVVVIESGRLVTTGTIDELTHHRALVRTPDPTGLANRLARPGVDIDRTAADRLVVTGLDLDEIGLAAHAAGIALFELSTDAASLEDVFLSLTSTSASAADTRNAFTETEQYS